MMTTWGVVVHYTLRGLDKLPNFVGMVLRGVPGKAQIVSQYALHRPVRWCAFISTTTSMAAASSFCDDPADSVIFRLQVTRGKVINGALSMFPQEGEVLLWPGQRFMVTRAAYAEGGRTFVDMAERMPELVY